MHVTLSDVNKLIQELPHRAEAVEQRITSFQINLEHAWTLRKEKVKDLSNAISSKIEEYKLLFDEHNLDSEGYTRARQKIEALTSLENITLRVKTDAASDDVMPYQDALSIFAPWQIYHEVPESLIVSRDNWKSYAADVLLSLMDGASPIEMGAGIAAAARSIHGWAKATNQLTSNVNAIKQVLTFEWYVSCLEKEGIERLSALSSKREKQMERFDRLLEELQKSFELVCAA
jgi:hypothetical protein